METVSAADANRHFSSLLRRVARGETLTVTSHGKPVATIAPAQPAVDPARREASERLRRHLQSVRPSGQARDWSRDDLYD